MAIIKDYADPLKNWAKVHNDWARDDNLDWGALGLLTFLTSQTEDFEMELNRIVRRRRSGRHVVMRYIAELEFHGYLRRETIRRKGVIIGTAWHLMNPHELDPARA